MHDQHLNHLIGENLKAIRDHRGLSLEKAASLTGVSKPMLGQIERGVSNPTVSTLWKIASGLNVPFTAFVEAAEPSVKKVRQADIEPMSEDDERYWVYPLFPMEEHMPFEIFTITLRPACYYPSSAHPKGVEEYIWVEHGCLTVSISGETYEIAEHEGIRFQADEPHTYENRWSEACEAVLLIYYPQPIF